MGDDFWGQVSNKPKPKSQMRSTGDYWGGTTSTVSSEDKIKSPAQLRAEAATKQVQIQIKNKDFTAAKAFVASRGDLPTDWRNNVLESIRKAEQGAIIEDLTIADARKYIKDPLNKEKLAALHPAYLLFTLDIQEFIRDEKFDEAAKKIADGIRAGKINDGTKDFELGEFEKKNLLILLVKVLAGKAQGKEGDIEKAIKVVEDAIKNGGIDVGGKIETKKAEKELKNYREDLHLKLLQNGTSAKSGFAKMTLDYMAKNEATLKKALGAERYDELKLKLEIDRDEEVKGGIEAAYKKSNGAKRQAGKNNGRNPCHPVSRRDEGENGNSQKAYHTRLWFRAQCS